jgi:16S rRNA G527 N7-methylase RsmG
MSDSSVINERFEALERRADYSGVASLVTVRAVRVDATLLRTSRHLLFRGGGRLFLLAGNGALRDSLSMFESVEAVELPVGGGSRLIMATA